MIWNSCRATACGRHPAAFLQDIVCCIISRDQHKAISPRRSLMCSMLILLKVVSAEDGMVIHFWESKPGSELPRKIRAGNTEIPAMLGRILLEWTSENQTNQTSPKPNQTASTPVAGNPAAAMLFWGMVGYVILGLTSNHPIESLGYEDVMKLNTVGYILLWNSITVISGL